MDIVKVNIDGLVIVTIENYEGTLPTPDADTGVAGWVDVTADPDRADILVGQKKYVGDPPDWVDADPTDSAIISPSMFLARFTPEELVYLMNVALTDAMLRMFFRLIRYSAVVHLDSVDDGSTTMSDFATYLYDTYIGIGLLWDDTAEADPRLAAILLGA